MSIAERRTEKTVTVNEAAFAAGVSVKAVNQAIDRKHIRTRELRRATDRAHRGIGATDVVYLAVSHVLAPEVRVELHRSFRGRSLSELPRQFQTGAVVLDLENAIREVEARLELLGRIDERIEADPGVRGGEPVFRGTRTPVFAIARKVELGSTAQELEEDHPHLRPGDLELATQYARLYPRRGRPRAEWARGMK
ncbi:MAG TPA: DUF433 domain-containing protein, partial [Longimicrobium sp.]|nr:DUF433 domain-containing protein [Longimicrobium sp.]